MESKVLFGTVMGFQTTNSKGGALVVKMEFPLTSVNSAYMTDIRGKNCKMLINPDEGQRELDLNRQDDNVLDFPEQDGEPEVNPDDKEEMDTDFEEEPLDEAETGSMPDLDNDDPDSEYLEEDQAEGI